MTQELSGKSIDDLALHLRRAINAGRFGIPSEAIAELIQTVGELVRRTRDKTKTKILAYLAHPLGPDGPQRDANREAASKILADLQLKYQDRVFVASWITLSGQWSETPENRKLGLGCDLALLEHCQEIWLAGPEISKGMQIELDFAKAQGLRVIDETYTLDRTTVVI